VLSVAAVATVLAFGSAGCGKAGSKGTTVGFLYVGTKDDYGYNQAHAQGAAAVKKISGVDVKEVEKVAESIDAQKVMESMIEVNGAKLIFPTSYNYFDPHVIEVAKKHPKVTFLHCGGLYDPKKHPENVGTYFGYIDECEYVSGIVAGHMTKTKKLGFVAAVPISQVRRNINAFALGARSVDPSITVSVVFTGDWVKPKEEGEAANNLMDAGCDILTCHIDSPKVVIEAAEGRGKMTCGYHASQATLAPKGYLVGAEWNWEMVYTNYTNDFLAGKKVTGTNLRGGLKEGIVRVGAYSPLVTAEAKKAADAAKDQLTKGTFVIFKGPIKDNEGKIVIEAGKELVQNAPELETMSYLVEGVKGK
jgi:simple sugar transport system substrate-binding protein